MSNKTDKALNDYQKKRERRKRQAAEQISKMKYNYGVETEQSIKDSEIIKFEDVKFSVLSNPINIIVEQVDSVTSILNHCTQNGKIAVLNFASFKNPGGGFVSGTHAQEECLCYESNLYNVLSTFLDTFYLPNREDANKSLYHSRGIYSPNIIFKRNNKMTRCDVITIASPNRGSHLSNHNGTEEENLKALKERISFVLETASNHNVKTLILGAFGCGVFKQDPSIVATIFNNLLETNDYGFNLVVFAIPHTDWDNNYDKFNLVLK